MATFDPKGKRCFINWENWNYTNQTFSCVSINNRSTNVDFNQNAIDWNRMKLDILYNLYFENALSIPFEGKSRRNIMYIYDLQTEW